MSTVRLTAAAPLPVLVSALGRSRWGLLSDRSFQGIRALLRTLADMLPARAGEGLTTQAQIADNLAYTPRHVQDLIQFAEALGLIEYRRGQVWEGVPRPGFVRVNKTALVDLLRAARPAHDQATKDRNHRTRLRIAGRTLKNTVKAARATDRPELKPGLPSLRGRRGGRQASQPPLQARNEASRKETNMATPSGLMLYMPKRCNHNTENPLRCNACRTKAMLAYQHAGGLVQVTQEHKEKTDPGTESMVQYMHEHHPNLKPGGKYAIQYMRDRQQGLVDQWEANRSKTQTRAAQ